MSVGWVYWSSSLLSLWVTPFSSQRVLNCLRMEKPSQQVSMHAFIALCSWLGVMWLKFLPPWFSCSDALKPGRMSYNMPFFPQVAFHQNILSQQQSWSRKSGQLTRGETRHRVSYLVLLLAAGSRTHWSSGDKSLLCPWLSCFVRQSPFCWPSLPLRQVCISQQRELGGLAAKRDKEVTGRLSHLCLSDSESLS